MREALGPAFLAWASFSQSNIYMPSDRAAINFTEGFDKVNKSLLAVPKLMIHVPTILSLCSSNHSLSNTKQLRALHGLKNNQVISMKIYSIWYLRVTQTAACSRKVSCAPAASLREGGLVQLKSWACQSVSHSMLCYLSHCSSCYPTLPTSWGGSPWGP